MIAIDCVIENAPCKLEAQLAGMWDSCRKLGGAFGYFEGRMWPCMCSKALFITHELSLLKWGQRNYVSYSPPCALFRLAAYVDRHWVIRHTGVEAQPPLTYLAKLCLRLLRYYQPFKRAHTTLLTSAIHLSSSIPCFSLAEGPSWIWLQCNASMNLSWTLHNFPETSSSMILTMILLGDIRKGYIKTKNDCSAKKLEPLWISGNVTIRQQVGDVL